MFTLTRDQQSMVDAVKDFAARYHLERYSNHPDLPRSLWGRRIPRGEPN